jgi:indole-3-glycerol phosphate synthase
MGVDKMIAYAHAQGLEVLLETHTENEFKVALETDADLIGINNRNLSTLKIDLQTTLQILQKYKPNIGKVVVSESGIKTSATCSICVAVVPDAFLVGSSIMLTDDIESKVKELVNTP